MLFPNPNAQRLGYDEDLRAILNIERARQSRCWLSNWDELTPGATPVRSLPGLAERLSIERLCIKDESVRSPLGSFKALGAPIALLRLILRRWPERELCVKELLAGRYASLLKDFVVVSATDGNHGRALAAAARSVGCRSVIVLHAHVSAERAAAIAALGAELVRVTGNYDESVREAARLATLHGWQVVSDTSYDGYEEIPRDVMQGYSIMVEELLESEPPGKPCPYTHVVLQGGVGGMAAGIASHFLERYGAARPTFIVVEPEQADCLMQSARTGNATSASGSVDSVMAGLACGQTSPLAWRFLRSSIDFFVTVSDDDAIEAMRTLAVGNGPDVPIVSGESGAAGLAALLCLARDRAGLARVGLDASSRVLLFNTEGATAPGVFEALIGRTADEVLAAQTHWSRLESLDESALMGQIHAHGEIGAIDDTGVCRIALTDADRQGRDQLVSWMRELAMQVHVDQIGNIFGTRAGITQEAPIMTGSHIDTVATGGRYDGVYGVMAGLEIVRWLNERNIQTRRPLVVAAFTNEEGVRFMPDMMGSLVTAGGLDLQRALDTIGVDGARLGDELQRIGYAGDMECGAIRPHAYVELHIEQGPVLEAQGIAIGAVQDLQGISWQEILITGQSNHAGTTPMGMRHDAGYCAAAIAVFARELARSIGGSQVATVGTIKLHPNLINVIASRATLSIDLRNTCERTLQAAESELAGYLVDIAAQEGVQIQSKRLARFEPVVFDDALVARIEGAATARGLSNRRMTSGAGHDAQMMARVCPSAMIFVPSRSGISHNPREFTSPAQLTQGANVLLDVLRLLADESPM